MTSQEKAQRFANAAPQLNKKEMAEINALFPAYIFRRHKTGEVWCTCCQHHGFLGNSVAERYIQMAEHQREARSAYDHPPKAVEICPYCHQPVVVKEYGRTGNRDNLCAYRRALVMRWYRGALWATAYDASKTYSNIDDLEKLPKCKLVGVYRFRPGLAEQTTRSWCGNCFTSIQKQVGPLHSRWELNSPFPCNQFYGNGYDTVGGEEILKSPFRYAVTALKKSKGPQEYYKTIELLTACCFYAQKIEMFAKVGMKEVVKDLVNCEVKHARVINWETTDPKKVLKITRQEFKDFLATKTDIGTAELYKLLKGQASMQTCAEWHEARLNYYMLKADANTYGIPAMRLIRYLDVQSENCHMGTIETTRGSWRDYLHAAQAMGYPLHRDNVLLPRNLAEAHETATEAHRRKMQAERAKAAFQREQERISAYARRKMELDKKYAYEDGDFLIRVPESADEIKSEGQKLKHCVGGYADRHVDGAATILFMRKKDDPDTPWLTIEMNGNRMIQIHGYRNEGLYTSKGRFAPDPREVHHVWLDRWLSWLEKGSPRNKDGSPKLPVTHKKKEAAA